MAAVDINPDVHENAQTHLGVPPEKCYTDLQRACDENPADICTVVVPPAFHESVVDAALAHDLHVISEKPIADTLEAAVRIAAKVQRAGKKMGVTMSHRFDQDKTTLRHELRSGRPGAIDYLVCRFTCGLRKFGDWGAHFRHTMEETLMIEGSVHHLDIIADMAGAKCDTLYAQTWNPSWGEYCSGSQGHVMMSFENGTRAIYEGAKTNSVLRAARANEQQAHGAETSGSWPPPVGSKQTSPDKCVSLWPRGSSDTVPSQEVIREIELIPASRCWLLHRMQPFRAGNGATGTAGSRRRRPASRDSSGRRAIRRFHLRHPG